MSDARAHGRVRDALRFIGVALVVSLLIFWGRAVQGSRHAYHLGEEAVTAGELQHAAVQYRHAIQWYTPIGGRGHASFDRLVALGDTAAADGDVEGALFAYRSARLGVMSTRHLVTPMAGELPALHQKIGGLMSVQTGDPADAARFTAQLDAYQGRRPRPILGLLASLFFIAWLGSLFAAAWRGFTPEGRVVRGELIRWVGLSFVLLAVWLACVLLA